MKWTGSILHYIDQTERSNGRTSTTNIGFHQWHAITTRGTHWDPT